MTSATHTIQKTTQVDGTWLGARGRMVTHQLSRKRLGLRVIAIFWLDDSPRNGVKAGDLSVKLIDGDGREISAKPMVEQITPNGTDADLDAFLAAHGIATA